MEPLTLIYVARAHRQTSLYPPLGLGYLVSVLKGRGYRPRAIDLALEKDDSSLKSIISRRRDRIYCLSFTTPYRDFSARVVREIKSCVPDGTIIAGGPHPTLLPEDTLNIPGVDVVVRGEGEAALPELITALLVGGKDGLSKVEGISYRSGGKTIHTGEPQRPADLDQIPFPDFGAFPVERYFEEKGFRELPLISARGCPMKCTFCQPAVDRIFGPKVRFRSPKNVVDELELIVKNYDLDMVFFSDDTFTADQNRVVEICEDIRKRKLKILWRCASTVGLRRETLAAMRESGCITMSFGVESGSPQILKNIEKNISCEKTLETFKFCKELGILTWAFLMVGNVGETGETVGMTADLVDRIKPFGSSVSIALPMPGTRLYDYARDRGMLTSRDDIEFDYLFSKDYKNMIRLGELEPAEVLRLKAELEKSSAASAERFRDLVGLALRTDVLKRLARRVRQNPGFLVRLLKILMRVSMVKSLRILNPQITSHQY